MAYTPTEWSCGDTITAEKLNKLENGLADCCGGGGSEYLIVTYDGNTLDHTYQEIYDAASNGTPVMLFYDYGADAFFVPLVYISDAKARFMGFTSYDSQSALLGIFDIDTNDDVSNDSKQMAYAV